MSKDTSRETSVVFDSCLLFSPAHIYFNSEENESCIRHRRDYSFRMLNASHNTGASLLPERRASVCIKEKDRRHPNMPQKSHGGLTAFLLPCVPYRDRC